VVITRDRNPDRGNDTQENQRRRSESDGVRDDNIDRDRADHRAAVKRFEFSIPNS
jgi:hypothetical protein